MKPGQILPLWFQRYVLGAFKSPQDLRAAITAETSLLSDDPSRFFGVPADGLRWDAPARLSVHPSFFTSLPYLRQSERADWQHANPVLTRWAALFVEYARKRNIPLYVHTAFRGRDDQERLVRSGVSLAPFPRSAHNIGEAVDIVHSAFHWQLSKQEWLLLSVLGFRALDVINSTLRKEDRLSLSWGGHFRSLYDPAHWEITSYRQRLAVLPVGPPVHQTPRFILRLR